MRHPDICPPVFQAVTLSFTSDKLATWLRSRADETTRLSTERLARASDALKEEVASELNEIFEVPHEDLVKAIKTVEQAEKIRVERAVEQLRFVADNLAPDATFEIAAEELLRFVTEIENPAYEPRMLSRSLGQLRRWTPRTSGGSVTKLADVD